MTAKLSSRICFNIAGDWHEDKADLYFYMRVGSQQEVAGHIGRRLESQ